MSSMLKSNLERPLTGNTVSVYKVSSLCVAKFNELSENPLYEEESTQLILGF